MANRISVTGITGKNGMILTGTVTAPLVNSVLTATDTAGTVDWKAIGAITGAFTADTAGYHTPGGLIGIGVNSAANVALFVGGSLPAVGLVSQMVQLNGTPTLVSGGYTDTIAAFPIALFTNSTTAASVRGIGVAALVASGSPSAVVLTEYDGIFVASQPAIPGITITTAIGASIGVPSGGSNNYGLLVSGGSVAGSTVSEIIRLGAGQTGDLTQWQTSGGTTLNNINQYGNLGIGATNTFKRVRAYMLGTLDGTVEASNTHALLLGTAHVTTPNGGSYGLYIGESVSVASGTGGIYMAAVIAGATKSGAGSYASTTGLNVNASTFGATNYAATIMGGNVGIGTATPAALLDVTNGTIRALDGTNVSPSGGAGVELLCTGSNGYLLAYNRGTSAYLPLVIGGSNVQVQGGSLGIGVSPSHTLHVSGDGLLTASLGVGGTNGIYFDGDSTNYKIYQSGGYMHYLAYSGSFLQSTAYGTNTYFSGRFAGASDTITSEISNDNNVYKELMLLGNKSGTGGQRNNAVYDNLIIGGALSKGSGTFLIDHPLDPANSDLYHAFIEGPRLDLLYRGRVKLKNGTATVNLDRDAVDPAAQPMRAGTFAALTQNAEVSSLCNQSGFTRLKPSPVESGRFTITAEDLTCTDWVSWVVIAERNDPYIRDASHPHTDPNGHLILETTKRLLTADQERELRADQMTEVKGPAGTPDVIENREIVSPAARGWPRHPKAHGFPVPTRRHITRTIVAPPTTHATTTTNP